MSQEKQFDKSHSFTDPRILRIAELVRSGGMMTATEREIAADAIKGARSHVARRANPDARCGACDPSFGCWGTDEQCHKASAPSTIEANAEHRWSLMPKDLHPATKNLVFSFAMAMADKLHSAEQKYGYSDGWLTDDWMDECRAKLLEHIEKGDPRDVAAYCAFLWHHKQPTYTGVSPRSAMGKLEKPAQVGNTIFGVGVSERAVIERAQRQHEYEQTPAKEAARLERVRAFVADVNQDAERTEFCEQCGRMRRADGTAKP